MHTKKLEKLFIAFLLLLGVTTSLTCYNIYTQPEKVIEAPKESPITSSENNVFQMNVGVANVLDSELDADKLVEYKGKYEVTTLSIAVDAAQKIRCTGYCDYGYTKSGEYVREGVVAGKEEWLGKTANIYAVNTDGSKGKLIGNYEFLDTGYGINGSLINGTSIDIWHPSEDAVWDWVDTYGDYVYMEIL